MNDSTKAFTDRHNIVRYFELLKAETDSIRRRMLSNLLADEMAKQGNGQKAE